MTPVLFPRQFGKVKQDFLNLFVCLFSPPYKETCKRTKMLVTLIARLLIGITFMQVLGGACSSRKEQRCRAAVILQFAELLLTSKNGAVGSKVGGILCAVIEFCLQSA